MPIVTISRIQHRRGDRTDLPQLASAELGWAIDTQQLYIGNGSIIEGAPEVGNTEILTEHTDLFSKLSSYIYKSNTDYEVVTGPSGNQPVTRTLQQRLDDLVSVKAFGAVGDGVTNDTAAINRALNQLYVANTNTPENRTTLYFPAGTYIISGTTVKIPSYANLVGDGTDKTVIKQIDNSQLYCAQFSDSLNQVYPNMGNNGASLPRYITISNLTFQTLADQSVFRVDSASHCDFSFVKFKGTFENLDATPEFTASVELIGSASAECHSITFNNCEMTNSFSGVICNDDYTHVVFDSCKFTQLSDGIVLGENTSGSGASVIGPRGVRVINSYFDQIDNEGLYVYSPVTSVLSAFNVYRDVGTSSQGIEATVSNTSCIIFKTSGNMSLGDVFLRAALDLPTVDNDLLGSAVFVPGTGYQFGGMTVTDVNSNIVLANNTVTATTTGISFLVTNETSGEVFYKITRNNKIRTGVIRFSANTTAVSMDEDYTENNGSVGVTFSMTLSGSVATLKYTSTNTGINSTMQYSIKTIRSSF